MSVYGRTAHLTGPRTILDAYRMAVDDALLASTQLRWPSRQYEHDIGGWAWDTVAIRLHPKQIQIAESLLHSPIQRTSVVACHKSGKTLLAAIIALWWFTMHGGRVVLFAPRMETVQAGLYHAVRALVRRSGVCGDCREQNPDLEPCDYPQGRCPHSCPITEVPHENAEDGLRSEDLREIKGYAANNPISLQGVSGRVLVLADEASGIDDDAMEAVDTSLASANSRLLLTGNANRSIGVFYDAFHAKSAIYNTFRIDAFEIVKYVEDGLLPASNDLCSRKFIEDELAKANGDESNAVYRRKILGLFPIESDETLIPRSLVEASYGRWKARREQFFSGAQGRHESLWARDQGPIMVGVDVAHLGPDLTSITLVRGLIVLEVWVGAKMEPEEIAAKVQELADKYRDFPRREVANIKIDALGPGEHVIRELREHQRKQLNGIKDRIEGVRSNEYPPRRESEFLHVRDELGVNTRDWLRAGGEIPHDITELHEELYTVTYSNARAHRHAGKIVLEHKDDVRKRLKRSPDRFDSLALALWDPHGRHEESWGARTAVKPTPPLPPTRPIQGTPYGYGSMGRPNPRMGIQGLSARLRGGR